MFFLRTTTVLLLSLTLLPAVTLSVKQKRNYNPFASSTLLTQSSPPQPALNRRTRRRPMDFGPFLADFDDPIGLPLPSDSKGRAPTGMIIDTRIPKGPHFPSHHQDDEDEDEPEAFERENAPHEIEDGDDDEEEEREGKDHRHDRSKHFPKPVNNRIPNGDHNPGNDDPDWNKVNFRARPAPNIPNSSAGPDHRRGDRPNNRFSGNDEEETPPKPLRNRAKQPTPRRHQQEEGLNQRGKRD